jgi:SAM-dependent methyltransferase
MQPVVPGRVRPAVTSLARESVVVGRHTFLLDRPGRVDVLDGVVPYWSEIWPASRMLAKAVLRETWPSSTECLEIGCGLGLGGIAALARGLDVTFADRDETALLFAAANARLNGFDRFRTAAMDFRAPPAGLRVPVLIGSDLLYLPGSIDPLIAFVDAVLAPDGVCLITDPDRETARRFGDASERMGWEVNRTMVRAGEPGGERHKGTLYRITKRGPLTS